MSNKNLFLAKSNPKETIMEHTDKLLDEFYLLKSIYPNLKNINYQSFAGTLQGIIDAKINEYGKTK